MMPVAGPERLARWASPALLVVFLLAVVTAASGKSATYDEAVHLYSGWRIWTAGDFSTNHEHPPLMKALAALPLAVAGVAPPRAEMRSEIDQWSVSHDFLYHANDGDRLLAMGRFPITLAAVLLGWALFRHASLVHGAAAGLAALALFVTEPNLLAHAGLVTTDLGITALFFLTVTAFKRLVDRPSRNRLLSAGALLGLALLAKFTAILLPPVLALVGALAARGGGRGSWRKLGRHLLLVCLIGLAVLNAGYLFSGSLSTLRSFTPESRAFKEYAAGPLGGLPLPLPREYVRGFDHAEAGGQRWCSYLFGEHSMTGWRHYYLAALAVKTPVPLLLLSLAGALFWRRIARTGPPRVKPADALLPLVPVLVILAAFTFSTNLKNIGLRYILPIYPFLCLLAGSALRLAPPGRTKGAPGWPAIAVIGLIVLQGAVSAWVYPDYLAFFNVTVGGPDRGAEVLLDSNLDWGQDLKGLGRYIREKGSPPVYVDYFGRACQRYYGVTSTPDFQGGLIAVSATHLKGVYREDRDRYRFLEGKEPIVRIGRSIFVYDAERPPEWKPMPGARGE